MEKTPETRRKNREFQKSYRERIKEQKTRITVVVRKDTHSCLKRIAELSRVSQGEVLDRIFREGIDIPTRGATGEVLEKAVDRFSYDNFLLRENAVDCIAAMLGFNTREILHEKHQDNPDAAKIAVLYERQDELMNEQKEIYKGNQNVMKSCLERYGLTIRKRHVEN